MLKTGQRAGAGAMLTPRVAGRNRFATGGPVGTDTVPALLTPGEFVVNKKSSQAIGYGNLANMNRYAAGGKVGAGRHSYGPGGMPPTLSFKGLDTVEAKLVAFGNHLDKMKMPADKQRVMYERLNQALMAGKSNVDAMKFALKGTTTTLVTTSKLKEAAARAAAKADQLEAAASQKAAGANQGMAGQGIMAVTMIAGMAQTMVDADTATGKVVTRLSNMVMQIGMVIMALEMFGLSLNKQAIGSFLKGGKGGRFAGRAQAKTRNTIRRAGRGMIKGGAARGGL